MTELKTLEDLVEPYGDEEYKFHLFEGDLRREAIKWVEIIKDDDKYQAHRQELPEALMGLTREHRVVIRNWIKTFFNIKEEDIDG